MSLENNTTGLQEILEQARNLPDATVGGGGVADAVRYTEQTLTEEQQAQARKNIGAGSPALEVIITDNGDGTGTADKTYEEMVSAHENSSVIFGRLDGNGIVALLQGFMTFDGTAFGLTGLDFTGVMWGVLVDVDGVLVGNVPMIPTALPNPYALTINGTAYDGSEAVDLTIAINTMIDNKLGVIENGAY